MKYVVSIGSSDIEFLDLPSAQNYATSIGLQASAVTEVEDVIPPAPAATSYDVFYAKVAAGYPIPNTPYSLALNDADRAQFSSMLILIRELLDARYITDDTPQTVKDKDDNIVTITTAQFRNLMIGYGIYYKTIWNDCEPKS